MICEYCGLSHEREYGSGRFCSAHCARGFSSKEKRLEINIKVSKKLTKSPKEIVCPNCSSVFYIKLSHKECCSNKCARNWLKYKNKWKDEDYILNFGFVPRIKLYEIVSFGKHLRDYLCVYVFDHPKKVNTVLYHRAVMEMYLGRLLSENEVVHHIDGNPSNNIITNLAVLSKSDHARLHKRKPILSEVI